MMGWIGSPTQDGPETVLCQEGSQVRLSLNSRSGKGDLQESLYPPSGPSPLSCKGMSRLAAVPPDEDPGEREAECELGCVQSLGPPRLLQWC